MYLDFEKPIIDLYDKIDQLKQLSEEGNIDLKSEILKIEKRAEKLKIEIYNRLTPSQIIQLARHPKRPTSLDLVNLISSEFVELHGDRLFRDDPSIIGGLASIDTFRVMVIGHQKGKDTKENIKRNFGMPHPEGYRKALRLMNMAAKFKMPIVTFIDTPGAYPGIGAEERGQAESIARNLREMTGISVPIISIVIGEGGSGGALGIAMANKLYMLQYSVYSVISPEGCASILFKDATKSKSAAESLKITAPDIIGMGIADDLIKEPQGGAHTDINMISQSIKDVIVKNLTAYKKVSPSAVVDERYKKFRAFGNFTENGVEKK